MTRIAPRRHALLVIGVGVVAGVGSVASAASAQETRARVPGLTVADAPVWSLRRRMPADSVLAFDARLGVVRPRRLFEWPGGDRAPAAEGVGLEAWLKQARERDRLRLWQSSAADRLAGEGFDQGLIPDLENPLKVPTPLARVFGEGSQFDVNGRLHMGAVGSRSRQEPDLRSELVQRTVGGFDLDLDQILDLKIVGTVGTKLDVAVDFNSSRELESRQLIAATYNGTDDEILKKIEVGDIRVNLPASRFLGSGVAQGTFGAQAVAQLGPVDFRVLGSRKEGQTTSRRISIAPQGEGVLQDVTLEIKDTQFQNDRFFLLFHPDSLASDRLLYPASGTQLTNQTSAPETGTLNVWLDDGNFANDREKASKQGIAFIDPTQPEAFPGQTQQGFFDLLVEGEDYVVTDGVILQLKRQLSDNETLAVSYLTIAGTEIGSPQEAETLELKLIKPINPDTVDFTWDYTLRNVYSLREPEIDMSSLSLEIFRGNRDLKQTFETIDGESRKYGEIFGITDGMGRVNTPRILRDPFGGSDYLVLPTIRPFFEPSEPSGIPISIEVPNRGLYFNSDPQRTALDNQIYFIEAMYLSAGGVTGEVELGAANIIDGSERISVGGVRLERGVDYQIFYEFGRVVFTDPAGIAEKYPNAVVDIQFEVAPLFNLAPTSLWGAATTYHMGDNAVLNSTVILQNKESLSNRPILGVEPTRTIIGEVDGQFTREFPFLTRWLDGLPGVETQTPSSVRLRGELAWSLPDPNTDGRVFLNDFENIELVKALSLFFRVWSLSSVPTGLPFGLINVGDARWFTFAVDARQITPGVRGVDRGENLLVVRFDPGGDTPLERRSSWRSIQTLVSTTGEDLSRQEFIEFFARGERGKLIVDLGVTDEDQVRLDANGVPMGLTQLDTEEDDPNTRDNSLDVGEDTGLDGVDGADLLGIPGDDRNDDFDQTFIAGFPVNPNGTENNTQLDTEDANFNGLLDRTEDLIRWEVDLSSDRYEVPGSRTSTGFRQIRLPILSPDGQSGAVDLRNVRVLRITFTDVETTTEFEIARLKIVGSTFLERGIVAADGTPLAGSESDSLRITAINDIENPDYFSPPDVVAEQDRANEVAGLTGVVREQSLEFGYNGLPSGARGTIFRPLFDRESYIDYEEMRVWVQGRDTEPGGQPEFFVTFGLDTLNVYEYGAPLLSNEWEEHVIDFGLFTELKRSLLDSLEAIGASTGSLVSEDGRYRVRIESETTPPPTLTDVSQLTIGVANTTGDVLSGSFWINEWRLTEPVREGDFAQFVNANVTLADIGTVVMTYENRGARYRNLSANVNNFERGFLDLNAVLGLEKFLPQSWGIAMPLTFDHYGSDEAPLFRVGSDIEVKDESEKEEQTRSNDRNVVTLRAYRTRQSSNPLIAATIDRLEARVTYRSEELGSVDLDTDRGRWETYVAYRHGFRKRGLPLGLGWIARLPWPSGIKNSGAMRRLATADLNLVPSTVTMTSQTVFEDNERSKRIASGTDFTADTTKTLRGTAQVGFQLFNSMRTSYTWDNIRDLNFPETVVSSGTFGIDALRGQSFDFDWLPPVSTWLIPRYSYTSSYNRNHTRAASRSLDSLDLRDFGVTTNQTLSLEFVLPSFVRALSGEGRRAGQTQAPSWWERIFEPIRFNRNRQETVSYVQAEDDPGFRFTLGLGDLEDVIDGAPQNVSENRSWSMTTGLTPARGLRIRTGYRETQNDRKFFQGSNETFTRTWPDINLRWTNARPPGFLGRLMPSVTINSDFERRISRTGANEQLLSDSDRQLWDPLVSVRVTWANGMVTDFRTNTSRTNSGTIRGGELNSRREESATDFLFNVNYNIATGTKMYIPFPTLWGVILKNPLRTSLTFAHRKRDDETDLVANDTRSVNLRTRTTEIRPSVAYEFGRVVSGFAFSYLTRIDRKRDVRNTTHTLEAFLDFLF